MWTSSSLEPPAWHGGCWSRGEWGSVNWVINASTARLITAVSSASQPGLNRKERSDRQQPTSWSGGYRVPWRGAAAHSLQPALTDQLIAWYPASHADDRHVHLLFSYWTPYVLFRFNRMHSIGSPITNKTCRTLQYNKVCNGDPLLKGPLNQFRTQTNGLVNYCDVFWTLAPSSINDRANVCLLLLSTRPLGR